MFSKQHPEFSKAREGLERSIMWSIRWSSSVVIHCNILSRMLLYKLKYSLVHLLGVCGVQIMMASLNEGQLGILRRREQLQLFFLNLCTIGNIACALQETISPSSLI